MRSSKTFSNQIFDAIAVLGIVLLTVDRWMTIGQYPPGLDGAQWLAIGRGFHGFGRATEGVYPPLIPVLATIGDVLFGPLPTIRVLAVGSGLMIALVIWLIARDALGPGGAVLVVLVLLPASALAEPVMYGGYPQQFALALGLTSLWTACRFLTTGNRRDLLAVLLSSVLAALAHHIYFPLILASVLAAAAIWFWPQADHERGRPLVPLFWVLFPSCVLFAVLARIFLDAGYSAPLDATTRSVVEAWRYSTREAPELWLIVVVTGLLSLAWTWRSSLEPVWLFAASLIGTAALVLAATGQPRLTPPVLIGSVFACGIGARQVAARFGSARPAIAAIWVAVALSIGLPAHQDVATYAGYYRVVDPSLVAAATAIRLDGREGGVAVRADRRGWPIGWWFEALQESPVLVGADERWLAFPKERERAKLAMALFDGDHSGADLQTNAERAEVRYLVVPKWEWIGWERWAADSRFPVVTVFDDDRYLVLRIVAVPTPQ